MSVAVSFRGGISGTVNNEEAESITLAFGNYQDSKIDELIDLHGRKVRISYLEGMETIHERKPEPLPIEAAMQKSVAEERDETQRKLKEAQLKIFRHNKQCMANNKMADYIWYYVEDNKIFRSTEEKLKARFAARTRA